VERHADGVEAWLRWWHFDRGWRSSPWLSGKMFGEERRGFSGLDMAVEGEDGEEELRWMVAPGETTTRTRTAR
jgi:hypothetical protein